MPTKMTDASDVIPFPASVAQAVAPASGTDRPHATAVDRTRCIIDPRRAPLAQGLVAKLEPKNVVDWDLIEIDYRAGVKTLEQIGKEQGISKGRISQVAKAKEWVRDLIAKIHAQADAKVQAAAAREKLKAEALNDPAKQAKRRLVQSEVVEANAEVQFRIRMEHRQDIGRMRSLLRSMLEELEVASSTEGQALIDVLAKVLSPAAEGESEEEQDRRVATMRRLLDKVTGGPARIDSAKKLTEMLEKLVKMEREAFGIAGEEKGTSEIDALLIRIGRGLS